MPQSEVQEGSPGALKHLHGTTALLQWLYQEYQQHPPPPPNQQHHSHSVSPTNHHPHQQPPPSPYGSAAVTTAASSSTTNNTPQQQHRGAGKGVSGGGTPSPSSKRSGVTMSDGGGADQQRARTATSAVSPSPGRPYNRLEGEGGGGVSPSRSTTAAVVQWAPNSNDGNGTNHPVVSDVGVTSHHNRTKHNDGNSVVATGKAKMRLSLSIEDVGSTGDTTNNEPHRVADADRRERTSPVFPGASTTTTTLATAAEESSSNPLAAPPHHRGEEGPSQDGSPHDMFFSMTVTPMAEKDTTNVAHHLHHHHYPTSRASPNRSQQKGPLNATRSPPSPSSPTSRKDSTSSPPSAQQQPQFPRYDRREAAGNAAAAALSNSSSGSSFAPRSPAWHGPYPREVGSSSSASLLPHHHRPHNHHPHHRHSAVSRSSSIGSATPLRSVGSGGGGRRQSGQQHRSPQESTISEQLARAQVQRRMALARLSARLRDGADTSTTSTKFLRSSQQQQRTTSPPQPQLSLLSGSPSNSSFGSTAAPAAAAAAAAAFRYPALQHPRAATSMSSSSQERESPTNAMEPPRPQSSLSTFSRGGNPFHRNKPPAVSASEAQQEEARVSAQRRVTDLRRAQRQKKDEENRLLDEILVARGRHQQNVELSAVQRSRLQSR